MGTGFGDRFSQDQTGDFGALVGALKKARGEEKDHLSPLMRLTDAFGQLKDMHMGQNAQHLAGRSPTDQAFNVPMPSPRPMDTPSPLDTAQYPFGPMGAPHGMAQAPMPAPRHAEAPPGAPLDLMQFNTAMMRDPSTGEFIDPRAAQTAEARNPFKGLFG